MVTLMMRKKVLSKMCTVIPLFSRNIFLTIFQKGNYRDVK